jgi:UPF0755 protein
MALSGGSKGLLLVLALLSTLAGASLWVSRAPAEPAGVRGETRTVVIPEGLGTSAIGDLLERQGVIRSATAFTILARLNGQLIQAGTYKVERGAGLGSVLNVLADGPAAPPTFIVTIPEGLTVDQTLARIAEADGSPFSFNQLRQALAGIAVPAWVPVEDLPTNAQPFEGLLFPDTYKFRVDADPQDVLVQLVLQTERVMSSMVRPAADLDRYQTLIVASLVEREARLAEERPRISSVIHNRLKEGIRLQIDATVLYALGEQRDRVLRADLKVNSLWNTYRHSGLPPTPISGVGRASIRAAAQPSNEDYLYYVVEDPQTGRHRFSRTFAEHQRAIAEVRGVQRG